MSNSDGIFSMRLVVADFYMEKPLPGLDPVYSEFRSKEIKRVPIIRIFGSNAQGQKTCMHIHGVFPYFYIPYNPKDFESLNKAIYQIAINLDKAINISLNQTNSSAQHVFKVQLVKGIPFYGYHRSAHQLLKIYMFNPRFIRRAANLLQNGAILNKNFHPHESHVPYILQFMIDYNLYGMSLIHVPLEIIKFRRNNDTEQIPFKYVEHAQILDFNKAKKLSSCALEIDIGSNFILNRFQLITKTNTVHSNPGIESIWNDERLRRQKLTLLLKDDDEKLNAIPPLEIPTTQERLNVQPTESEMFYRTALLSKLLAMENSLLDSTQTTNQSINSIMNLSNVGDNFININASKQKKRKFNLSKILQNSVYPEECSADDNLINASVIQNHFSNNSVLEQSLIANFNEIKNVEVKKMQEDESVFLDDTVIDEELVLSLTQIQNKHIQHQTQHVPMNATLREEDMQLLDILQQLEESNEDKIDLDSSLAPLSQTLKNFALPHQELDKEATAAAIHIPNSDSDSEDENDDNVHDFSIVLENVDDLIQKLTQSQRGSQTPELKSPVGLQQVDGSDDLLRTPTKTTKTKVTTTPPRTPTTPKNRRLTMSSPCRSPKTPKTAHKFAQLPLVPVNRSTDRKISNDFLNGSMLVKAASKEKNNMQFVSLRKKLALTDLRRKSISVERDVEDFVMAESTKSERRRSKRLRNLDDTHVTCSLTPRRMQEKLLKVYNVDKSNEESNQNEKDSYNEETKVPVKESSIKIRKKKKITKIVNNDNLYTSEMKCGNEKVDFGSDSSCKNLRKTPNLKRLRRSPLTTNSAKITTTTKLNTNAVVNSLKFEVAGESHNEVYKITSEACISNQETMTKDVKLRKCKVQLKKMKNIRKCENTKFLDINNSTTESKLTKLEKLHHLEDQEISEKLEQLKQALKSSDLIKSTRSTSSLNVLGTSPPAFNEESSDEEITETPLMENHYNLKVSPIFDKSKTLQSPSLFSQSSSPVIITNGSMQKLKTPLTSNSLPSEIHINLTSTNDHSLPMSKANMTLTPLDLPPTREEVLRGCCKFQIYEHEFQQPFYSNPDDITKHKELGFTILHIPGNKLNDVEEFRSILDGDVKGLTAWRRKQLLKLGGPEILNKYRNGQRIREYFANQHKIVTIMPQINAPTRQEIKLWLKARELLKSKGDEVEELRSKNIDEDSPIKIRRQKVTMMLNPADDDGDSNDVNNSLDCSSRSLTLTPLTPATSVEHHHSSKQQLTQSVTPVSRHLEKIPLERISSLRKRNNCRVLRRISLNKQLKEAFEKECQSKKNSYDTEITIDSQESVLPNSQTSENSVSSETALAELERSSFMRNIKQIDATIGGFSENSTLNNTFGFKMALENLQQAKADMEYNYLTIVTLEVFVATRDDLFPNPELDEIRCLFYAIENNIPNDHIDSDKKLPYKACGYIMVHDARDTVSKEGRIHGIDRDIDVTIVQTEIEALEALLGLCSLWDPDIFAGYEIEMSSWGFIIERAKHLCLNIAPLLSRVPTQKASDFVDEDRDSFTDLDMDMKLCGRILLDVWRLLRSEIALTSYTFENVMYHIMHKRCPWHSYRTLTNWYFSPCSRWIVIEYYLERVRGTLALLDHLDIIGRTSEMAKLIGIQFYEVLSRGSQFRVESMMLRIAKPKNLVPLSPSVQQRAHMRAPEYLPLIMEPQSRFYADPVIVLDFQSLYPSMIIAYNYCFSTSLGRVEHLGQTTPFEFGASQLRVSPTMLRKLIDRDLITISPCGVVFVKSSVREGILPRMLTEILDTRQMVKQSMKLHKSNSALQRILHSRQLGLKLMANVTYGYTAANFSGRMPAVEVGDSVVSKGRETLERAIKMVEANDKWNVRVVYGDTDSMFVLVPGRNRDEAFRIGEEIVEAVTNQNPHPVKLKLEKVYQPCILQTKKRYVGYMYETPDQKEPVYEAKGIETVRRDGCPIVAKMLEKVLRILFESADVSQVKHYVCRQFTKLLSGRANIQDLIFAKEFRGLNGYRPTACVPALELTRKWIQTDPRRVPRRGERVPFIITNGPPGVPLIRLIRHPHEVLANEGLKINAIYYITKAIIPPLNRCLLLIGADVNEWFANLPRKILLSPALSMANEMVTLQNSKSKKSTISQFFSTTNCIVECGRQTKQGICTECSHNSTRSTIILQTKISKIERTYLRTQHICEACCGRVGDLNCDSLDCPVLYVLESKRRDLQQITHFRNLLKERFH